MAGEDRRDVRRHESSRWTRSTTRGSVRAVGAAQRRSASWRGHARRGAAGARRPGARDRDGDLCAAGWRVCECWHRTRWASWVVPPSGWRPTRFEKDEIPSRTRASLVPHSFRPSPFPQAAAVSCFGGELAAHRGLARTAALASDRKIRGRLAGCIATARVWPHGAHLAILDVPRSNYQSRPQPSRRSPGCRARSAWEIGPSHQLWIVDRLRPVRFSTTARRKIWAAMCVLLSSGTRWQRRARHPIPNKQGLFEKGSFRWRQRVARRQQLLLLVLGLIKKPAAIACTKAEFATDYRKHVVLTALALTPHFRDAAMNCPSSQPTSRGRKVSALRQPKRLIDRGGLGFGKLAEAGEKFCSEPRRQWQAGPGAPSNGLDQRKSIAAGKPATTGFNELAGVSPDGKLSLALAHRRFRGGNRVNTQRHRRRPFAGIVLK